ncbi:probable pectinesterase 55 [Punica granatum]|uniref:pectinesterase n=1 Tax=Punica granatum TaxID=22663 RepID=A0A6P8EG17_PUNGR|nr:probable pectinesterase 55 [Punica granatum]
MSTLALLLVLVLTCSASSAQRVQSKFHTDSATVSVTVIVDRFGSGNFTTVQQAIDWAPTNNNQWIRIHVKAGTYTEQVSIPQNKPYILLEGEGRKTIIQSGGHGSVRGTSTFTVNADNFVASRITFKNTYNVNKLIARDQDAAPNARPHIERAPAVMIWGDKASFYACGFVSLQDTLSDMQGRHYFNDCYIEGAVDFIWGFGQSIYEHCHIYSTHAFRGRLRGLAGYITAQGRLSSNDSSGFVFKYCIVNGDGNTYLGRAYRAYSRVIFFKSKLGGNVVPEGWNAGKFVGEEFQFTYAEEGCYGPGSNNSNRVKWMKTLNQRELAPLVSRHRFIDRDGWIKAQPSPS